MLAAVSAPATDLDTEAHYDAWAGDYERDLVGTYGYNAHRVAADALVAAGVGPEALVVDLGCGTGLVGEELARRGFCHLDGVDVSARMLEKAAAKAVYRELAQQDLTRKWALDDGSYDAVVSVGSFGSSHLGPEHLADVARVVRPGGHVVLYFNARCYDDDGYEGHFRAMAEEGVLRVERSEESNYMDALDRPGRLVVATRPPR